MSYLEGQPLPRGFCAGPYVIEEAIARGGAGSVYRASGPEGPVAIKVLHQLLARSSRGMERFLHEARVVRAVDHPNIVKLLETGELPDGRPFFAMEYLAGESLEQRLAGPGLAVPEIALLAIPICSALDAVHAAGIVHRDIKASNLVFTAPSAPAGAVKLVDFGIAKLRIRDPDAPQTTVGTVLGSPHYMAPEQLRGETVSPRTDIYALGVLLFRAFTGRYPYQHQRPAEVCRMHLLEPPPAVSDFARVPERLDDLFFDCLAKRPDQRPASAGELAGTLAKILGSRQS